MERSNKSTKDHIMANRRITLPSPVLEALNSMKWEVMDLPPMFYEDLSQMAGRRTTKICIFKTISELKYAAISTGKTVDLPGPPSDDMDAECTARIITALLLLGNGFTDEAHDLVLSLSWRGELPYAYGSPVDLDNEELQALACYTHCLVHRREGPHPSEFDMTGFQNSNYWAGHTMKILVGADILPLQDIQMTIREIASKHSEAAKKWVKDNVDKELCWDPRLLTELCSEINRSEDPNMHPLKDFAEQCALFEMRWLVEHILFDRMNFER